MPATHDIRAIEQVFSIWDSVAELSREVGVPYDRAAKWSQRGRFPNEVFDALIAGARRKRVTLTHELLNRLNKPRGTAKVVG